MLYRMRLLVRGNKFIFTDLVAFLFHFFICQTVFGQGGSLSPTNSPLDILQGSPTVNSLGSYGGVNVGVASGTIQKTIDLYKFVSGPLVIPIAVNYASNGLKVNDNGGVVGTGWNASIGGVIRRTVMGNIDVPGNNGLPENFNPYAVDRQTLNYFKGLISYNGGKSSIDGEQDIFSFSFQDYSGKFILAPNGDPILLNHSGLKIIRNVVSQKTTYIIITPDGVRYEFGEVETSYKAGVACGRIFSISAETGYFLTKITHPSGNYINLVYTGSVYNYLTGIDESQVYSRNLVCSPGDLGLELKNCVTTISTQTKLLQEINSTEGRIVFTYIDHQAKAGKILSDFKVYRTGEVTPIKQVLFNYLSHYSGRYTLNPLISDNEWLKYRSFLKEIKDLNADGAEDNKYIFDYLGLDKLPNRFANCQDYYGYFNGKGNSSLIPNSTSPNWSSYFVPTNSDRKPDGNYVTAGMLSKITYPTGGTDSLIYEPNSVWERYGIPSPIEHGAVTATGTGSTGTGIETSSVFNVGETQNITIYFSCDLTVTDGPYPGNGTVELLSNGSVSSTGFVQSGKTGSMVVTLQPGVNYQVRVKAVRGYRISCSANYSYRSEATTYAYKNQTSAGVRIAQVISKADGVSSSKKFYYHKINDTEKKSTAYPIFTPTFEWETQVKFKCLDAATCLTEGITQIIKLSSDSRFGSFYFNDAPIYYSDVFEVDNETNGGISYQFGISPNSRPNLIRGMDLDAPWTSNDDLNGLELNRLYFKFNGNQIVPVKSVKTSYKNDPRIYKVHKAFVGNERYIPACGSGDANPPAEIEIEPFDILEYDHFQQWIYADTVITRDYALNGTDYNERTEINVYDNPLHAQLSRKILLKSDGTKTIYQEIYPDDYVLGTVFINDMITNHLTGFPIESVVYTENGSNRNIIEGTITSYKAGGKGLIDNNYILKVSKSIPQTNFKFSNRNIGILPQNSTATQFSMDGKYINNFKIISYNPNGYPQEVSKKFEPITTYLWGYGGKYPVAEIKNATYLEVLGVLGEATLNNINAVSVADNTIVNAMIKVRSDIPKAQVTSFTYKPFIGMTSKTDSRGITEFYTYDNMSRLQAVLDHFNNVNKSFNYHFRPN
ncbi:hypothetical protein [Sphingobacterium multivorum]|uniref:hypothetical protein n=1 Tax=Sphingobacterium multivorum TaxID=28454 RepID=UPI00345EB9AF